MVGWIVLVEGLDEGSDGRGWIEGRRIRVEFERLMNVPA